MTTVQTTRKKSFIASLSLRNKLIVGSMVIVFLAITIMGLYVFFRTREINSLLTSQLDQNVVQLAESKMDATADLEASKLNSFFSALDKNTLALQSTGQNFFADKSFLGNGQYWDARTTLFQLPNGSWDNPNADVGSVFVPITSPITDDMIASMNTMKQMDFVAPSILATNPDVIAVYFGGNSGYTLYYPNVDLAALVPANFDVTSRPWYTAATPTNNSQKNAVWSEPYLDAALNGIVITVSAPVYDRQGKFQGVVAQDIQLTRITDVVTNIRVGDSGYAFLIDKQKRLIAMPNAGYKDLGISSTDVPLGNALTDEQINKASPELLAIISKMTAGESQRDTVTINNVERFIVYRPIPNANFSLAIVVPVNELTVQSMTARESVIQATSKIITTSALIILSILALTLLVTLGFSNALTSPLEILTKTAQEIAQGKFDAKVEILTQDEMGTLADAINFMAAQLKESIVSLEQRVTERTSELESANQHNSRRARQFEAVALVARTATSIQELDTLLPRLAEFISEQFGFYHTGIFFVDENHENAVLQASNSQGGKRMLEKGHRLKVGQTGIVGYVAATGIPRIALDVGADAVYFDNPDLPDTRSEMALPLRIAGQIIGILDIQSTEPNAFNQEDIDVLSTLADQVTIAIQNARAHEQTQRLLAEAQERVNTSMQAAWNVMQQEKKRLGYHAAGNEVKELTKPLDLPQIKQAMAKGEVVAISGDSASLAVPIRLRDTVIGVIHMKTPAPHTWDPDQIDIAKEVAGRLSLAIEAASLLYTAQHRAEIERVTTDITSKISSSTHFETILQTAAQELSKAMGGSDVLVQIEPAALDLSRNE